MDKNKKRTNNFLFRKELKRENKDKVETTVKTQTVEIFDGDFLIDEPIVEQVFPIYEKEMEEEVKIKADTALIEEVILRDIYLLLDEEKDNLNKIKSSLAHIEDEESKAFASKETEKLKKELENIEKKLEAIAGKLDSIEKLNFRAFSETADLEIELFEINQSLIDHSSENIDVKRISKYIKIVTQLIDNRNKQEELAEKIDDKHDDLELKEDKKEVFDKGLSLSDKELEKVNSFNDNISSQLDNLQDKIDLPIDINKETNVFHKIVIDTNKIIEAIILFNLGKDNKSDFLEGAFKAAAIIALVKSIKLKEFKETSITANMENLSSQLGAAKLSLDEADEITDKSLNSIEDMKDIFDEAFKDSSNKLPEYQKMFRNIIKLEDSMLKEKEKLRDYKKDFDDKEKEYSKKYQNYQTVTEAV